MSLTPIACLLAALCCTASASPALLTLSTKSRSFGNVFSASLGDEKIVGGFKSSINKHPYMVSVEEYYAWDTKWFHKCGGTVLNHWNILSAAHCIEDEPKASYRVRAGSTKRGVGGTLVTVAKVFYHPKFNSTAIDYDVGLFRMAKSLAYTTVIKPIHLPKIGAVVKPKTSFNIIGWGAEETNMFIYPRNLRETTVAVVDAATCAKDYKGTRAVSKRMICASAPGKDSCSGDSGGPMLQIKGGNGVNDIQYGIVSWGDVCAEAQHPGVYTSLADPEIRSYIATTLNTK